MAPSKGKLAELLKDPFQTPVYYFAYTESALLREATAPVVKVFAQYQEDGVTLIEGPTPDMGEVIGAAGAISLFGDARVVLLREISPSAMPDKDVEELAELFANLENAVLIVTALYKDKRAATSKKAKLLMDAAARAGYAEELKKPTRRDNIEYIQSSAAALNTRFASGAADALLERAGENRPLLENEVAKLAAISGYGEITTRMVERYGARNVEADVFMLVRHITSGDKASAYALLRDLFTLKNEPIAISAALSGTFVDMLRVRTGERAKKSTELVFKEMGYTGNPYRLQKARENAWCYTDRGVEDAVQYLAKLDMALKSSAISDKTVLLEAAVEYLVGLRR